MYTEKTSGRGKRKRRGMRDSLSDRIFYAINGTIMLLLALIVIYPLWYMLIASISSPEALFAGEVYLLPKQITWLGYERLFQTERIVRSFLNTVLYTLTGTAFSLLLTITCGWALSRKEMPFRKAIMILFIITMFFSGGMIPYYLTIRNLQLLNNPLVMIIPGAVSAWNVFMTKAFYTSAIPKELVEAAGIDGADKLKTFVRIILPLSAPIIAVMALISAVGKYNNYFDSMMFLQRVPEWHSLQYVIYELIINIESIGSGSSGTNVENEQLKELLKYSSIIVSTIPILSVFPFTQKYFSQGMMIGSVKD